MSGEGQLPAEIQLAFEAAPIYFACLTVRKQNVLQHPYSAQEREEKLAAIRADMRNLRAHIADLLRRTEGHGLHVKDILPPCEESEC